MSQYLLMVLENEGAHGQQAPKAVANLIAEKAAFAEALRRDGALNDSGTLRPSREGRRLRRLGTRVEVNDGPFLDGGRALGAYYLVEASDAHHAAQIALSLPMLPEDTVEARPLMKCKVDAEKDGKPGKIFAFAVLGSAPNEEAWTAIMDRVDEETPSSFGEGFLGGGRLLPPKSGQRLVVESGLRAMLDGPFLESKEIIGGIFFMRMTSIEHAVRWAEGTHFLAHGALEIRELWRT